MATLGLKHMLDLHAIKADPSKLLNGSWWRVWPSPGSVIDGEPVRDRPPETDAAFLIVPFGVAYERALDKARKPFMHEIRDGKADDVTLRQIQAQALAEAALKGWQGLTMGGEAIPYSEEKAIDLLSSPAWTWLHDFVHRAAQFRAASLAVEEAKAAGN
jgi:hypothetical protein